MQGCGERGACPAPGRVSCAKGWEASLPHRGWDRVLPGVMSIGGWMMLMGEQWRKPGMLWELV